LRLCHRQPVHFCDEGKGAAGGQVYSSQPSPASIPSRLHLGHAAAKAPSSPQALHPPAGVRAAARCTLQREQGTVLQIPYSSNKAAKQTAARSSRVPVLGAHRGNEQASSTPAGSSSVTAPPRAARGVCGGGPRCPWIAPHTLK
jgi:hypothetical protein